MKSSANKVKNIVKGVKEEVEDSTVIKPKIDTSGFQKSFSFLKKKIDEQRDVLYKMPTGGQWTTDTGVKIYNNAGADDTYLKESQRMDQLSTALQKVQEAYNKIYSSTAKTKEETKKVANETKEYINTWSSIGKIPEGKPFQVGDKTYIKKASSSIKDIKKSANDTKNVFQNMTEGIRNGFDRSIASVKRFALSLFGIQSIWRVVSRAASSYLSYDTELSNKITNNWVSFGAMLEPVLTFITNLISKLIGYVNVFVKAFTGIDYIARASNKATKSIKGTTQATKELNKQLTSLDEITNLSMDNLGGFADEKVDNPFSDLANIELDPNVKQWIEDVALKLKDLWNWCVENKEVLLTIAGLGATVFVGWKVGSAIGSIASLLGVSGGSYGLYGIVTALLLIEALGIAKLVSQIKEYKELLDQINKQDEERMSIREKTFDSILSQMEEAGDNQERINWLSDRAAEEYNHYLDDLKDGTRYTQEQKDKIDDMVSRIESVSGKKFRTQIEAEMDITPSEISTKRIDNWLGLFTRKLQTFVGGSFGGGGGGARFASGTVAYKPTFGQFGEYPGASSNPEIVSPQNIMRQTFTDAMMDILPYIQTESRDTGDIILEINGREFARATYPDFEEEGHRLGKSTVIRRV